MSYICKKAYCSTNVLFRCFHTANTAALIRGYKSFILPVLEYCSTVCNPYIHFRHFIGMTDQLENVQIYFTRRVYYRCKLEYKHVYPEILLHLTLESLELRCLYHDIIMVYTIVHKLTRLNDDVLLSYHNANYNYHVVTRGHTLKLKKNMLLDLMWLEIICVTQWYLYGMGCQNMLLLLLHLHCSRNVCVP